MTTSFFGDNYNSASQEAAAAAAQSAEAAASSATASANSAASAAATIDGANAAVDSAVDAAATATAKATEASTSASDAASSADAAAASVDACNDIATEFGGSADEAAASAAAAAVSEQNAIDYANAPYGQDLGGGKKSGLHWSTEAQITAQKAASAPTKVLTNSDGPTYTFQASDLYKLLNYTGSNALAMKCPPGLFTGPGPDGSQGAAWIKLLRTGSGLPTVSADTSAPINPSILFSNVFQYTAEPGAPTVINQSISVPTGNNRRIHVFGMGIYQSVKTGRNSTCAITNTSSFAKVAPSGSADSSDGSYATGGDPISGAVWTGQISGSDPVTCAMTFTPDGDPTAVIIFVCVVANGDGQTGAAVTGEAAGTGSTLSQTTPENNSIAFFGFGWQGADAINVTVGSGTVLHSGKTSRTRTSKDIAYAFGYELVATAGAKSYIAASPKSAKHTKIGLMVDPQSGSSSVTFLSPDGATLSAAGDMATLWLLGDGTTYIKEG